VPLDLGRQPESSSRSTRAVSVLFGRSLALGAMDLRHRTKDARSAVLRVVFALVTGLVLGFRSAFSRAGTARRPSSTAISGSRALAACW
jgi:hypothetical protein